MFTHGSTRHNVGQLNLIGMLVSIAILVGIMAVVVPPMLSSHSAKGQPRTPTEQAYGAGCSEYTGQMNMAVIMYKGDHEGHPPQTLEDLKSYGVTNAIAHAKGCEYQMDPATGLVSEIAKGRTPAPGQQYPLPGQNNAAPAADSAGGAPQPPPPADLGNPGNIHIPNMQPNVSGF